MYQYEDLAGDAGVREGREMFDLLSCIKINVVRQVKENKSFQQSLYGSSVGILA